MTKIPSVEERMAEFTRFGVHSYIERTDDTELLPIDEFFSGVVENEKGETVVLSDWLRKTLTAEREAGARTEAEWWSNHAQKLSAAIGSSKDIVDAERLGLKYAKKHVARLKALTPPTK